VDDTQEGSWSRCCQPLSYLVAAVDGGAFPGDVKPPGLDICDGVDCMGTYSPGTGSPRARLPGARVCPEPGYEVGLYLASLRSTLGTRPRQVSCEKKCLYC
jgi:hypothetical protein